MENLQDLTKKTIMPELGKFEVKRELGICDIHRIECEILTLPFSQRGIKNCPLCTKEQEKQEKELQVEQERQSMQAAINRRLENSMLAPRFKEKTFVNYKAEGDKQTKILESAKWFLENVRQSAGLILIGKTGTGKNHLAAAIIHEAVNSHTCLFTEAIKLIRTIKESWKSEGLAESQVLKQFLAPDILVIDEIGVLFGSETERLYLTELINDRYSHCKPTILIANLSIQELKAAIGDRAVDRFKENGRVLIFDWSSYRGNKTKEMEQ